MFIKSLSKLQVFRQIKKKKYIPYKIGIIVKFKGVFSQNLICESWNLQDVFFKNLNFCKGQ